MLMHMYFFLDSITHLFYFQLNERNISCESQIIADLQRMISLKICVITCSKANIYNVVSLTEDKKRIFEHRSIQNLYKLLCKDDGGDHSKDHTLARSPFSHGRDVLRLSVSFTWSFRSPGQGSEGQVTLPYSCAPVDLSSPDLFGISLSGRYLQQITPADLFCRYLSRSVQQISGQENLSPSYLSQQIALANHFKQISLAYLSSKSLQQISVQQISPQQISLSRFLSRSLSSRSL